MPDQKRKVARIGIPTLPGNLEIVMKEIEMTILSVEMIETGGGETVIHQMETNIAETGIGSETEMTTTGHTTTTAIAVMIGDENEIGPPKRRLGVKHSVQ
jgi:hypothetical protein